MTVTHSAIGDHITHPSGRRKTICTSTVLWCLDIPTDRFNYSQSVPDMIRILNRHGYSVRSRLSTLGRGQVTVSQLRKRIASEPPVDGAHYLIGVPAHVLLLSGDGSIVCDTAPRERDRRRVTELYIVRRKA